MAFSRWLCFLFLMSLTLPMAGAAAESRSSRSGITVETHQGHVIARTEVHSSMAAAHALLGNPKRIAAIEGRGSEVTSRQVGDCIESEVVAPSGVGKIRYTSISCPTPDGFRGSLVSSKQIRSMEARWTITETKGRVQVSYDLYFVPRIRVPQRLVAALAKRGVRRLLEAVQRELEHAPHTTNQPASGPPSPLADEVGGGVTR